MRRRGALSRGPKPHVQKSLYIKAGTGAAAPSGQQLVELDKPAAAMLARLGASRVVPTFGCLRWFLRAMKSGCSRAQSMLEWYT